MNYYEQFYDDLEFADEEEEKKKEEKKKEKEDDPFDARSYAKPSPGYDAKRSSPGYGYEEEDDWTHRDQKYEHSQGHSSRGHHRERGYRDNIEAYYTRGYEGKHSDDYDEDDYYEMEDNYDRDGGYSDRGSGHWERGFRGRGRANWDRGRGFGDRGRGNWNRGRGFNDRGRGPRNRGRGFPDRGRGNFDRGRGRGGQRGGVKNSLAFNFVKAKDPDPTPEPGQDTSVQDVVTAPTQPAVPVCPGYGYGVGSDFEQFGSVTPEGVPVSAALSTAADPGVPGLEEVSHTQPPADVAQSPAQPLQTGPKIVTAVVKPMYNFVKAKAEFKSTDVAFHETAQGTAASGPAQGEPQGAKRAGIGMPTGQQKVVLQTFDVAEAFHAGAKDGRNPKFDTKFNKLRDAVKACCRLPSKNSIEVIHMAVDKVKMKITDINKPGGRAYGGQVMFYCRLEVDGVFVAEGAASNKKTAKHEAYNNGKQLLEGGPVYVIESSPGLFQVKQTTPGPGTTASFGVTTPSTTGPAKPNTPSAAYTAYSKPKIVFHTPAHPMANKPLEFARPVSQQSSAAAGALATKLLNFVKEGAAQQSPASTSSTTPPQTFKPATSQQTGPFRPGVAARPNISDPGRNMLKRALDSANMNRLRYKKQKMGPTVLDDLTQFIIYDTTMVAPTNTELSILHQSANQNKVVLKIEHEVLGKEDDYAFLCTTYLGDHMVASTTGTSKEDAKTNSAREALCRLKEICYTIRVKQAVDNDADGVTKDELTTDKASDVIGDSNIGNKMLKAMGWVGGGMGKDGRGIAEPVKTEMIIGREGLGLKAEKGLDKDFNKRVTDMLEQHIKSDDQRDLHFSSELTKEERAVIHQIGQKLGLKTQSKGKGDNRYLIVSRKRSVGELLEHVLNSGGSTDKYEVMEPKNPVGDPRYRESVTYGHSKQ